MPVYFMQKKGLISLLRPLNCAIAAFAVFIGYCVSAGAIAFNQQLAFAMAAAFMVCGAGQSINDFFDNEIDKKKNPRKPIPSGAVSANQALLLSAALFLIGNFFAFFVNQQAFLIAIAFTVLLVVYSAFLGKAKFIGNWVVAAGTAFTLVFGASINGNYFTVAFLAASALLANAAREIIKDREDIDFDKGFKNSLPMTLNDEQLFLRLVSLHAIALVLAFLPLATGIFGNVQFAVLIIAANALFGIAINKFSQKDFSTAQRFSKAGMMIALIGFLAGVV
jgi:geranylgeranylglycerol-phosphate geranylgeranyltransferase